MLLQDLHFGAGENGGGGALVRKEKVADENRGITGGMEARTLTLGGGRGEGTGNREEEHWRSK